MSATTFEACLARFRSPDPGVRRQAAEALGGCNWSEALPPLVEGLKDENPGVQEAVMAALIRIG